MTQQRELDPDADPAPAARAATPGGATAPPAGGATAAPADGTRSTPPAPGEDAAGEALGEAAAGGAPAAPALPAEPGEAPPSRARLAAEAVGMALITLALSFRAIPALRDQRQTFYEDVILNWFGPQSHGLGRLAQAGIWLPVYLRTNYGGEPYLANTQHGAAYPLNAPFWFLDTSTALETVVLLHFVLAAVAMWAYRRLGLRTSMWAGWLAGICFTLGAGTLAHITLGGHVEVICLMPLIFLTGHMALERRTLRWVVACAVSIGLGFLAGHVEVWLYIMVALALYGLAWILFRERGGIGRRALQAVATLGGALGLFILLFGWQLFPSLLLSRGTYRTSPSFRQQYPTPKEWAFNTLLPDYDRLLVGENEAFIGLVATCLIGLAMVARSRQLLWVKVFVVVSVAVGLSMAIGNQQPVYRFLYDNVSLLRGFRVPSRWLLLASFGMCVGAAIGLDQLLTAHVGRWRERLRHGLLGLAALAVAGVAALLVVDVVNNGRTTVTRWGLVLAVGLAAWLVASVRRVPRAIPALVILGITSVELIYGRPGAEWRQKAPDQLYDAYGANLETLSAQGGRYLSVAGAPRNARQQAAIPIPEDIAPGPTALAYWRAGAVTRVVARPDTNLAVQAESIVGRDGGFLPARWYREFYYAAAGGGGDLASGNVTSPPSRWNWAALDFLALRWFVTDDELPAAERAVLERNGFAEDGRYGYAVRWERPGTSLARLVHEVDVLPVAEERVARLGARYPLANRAIVEEPVAIDPGRPAAGTDQVQATTRLDGTVDVRVRTDRRSLLVLADVWFPGARVTVDGEPAELVRTNHAFRGVVVPAGEHEVRFTYTDRPLQAGFGLAAVTILGLAVAPLVARRRRGQPAAAPGAGGGPDPDGSDDGTSGPSVPAAGGGATAADARPA